MDVPVVIASFVLTIDVQTSSFQMFFCLERLSGAQGLSPTLVAQVVLIATVGCHAQGEILTRHAAPHSKPVLPLGSAEGMPARGASSTLRSLTQPRWGG